MELAAGGFRVVRFDNRDGGLSTPACRPPVHSRSKAMMARALFGLPVKPPYTLDDMARNTVGLMDALGIGSGPCRRGVDGRDDSADRRLSSIPSVYKSLASIMSTSGEPRLAGPEGQGAARAASPAPAR